MILLLYIKCWFCFSLYIWDIKCGIRDWRDTRNSSGDTVVIAKQEKTKNTSGYQYGT
jgi:hypothetical protein